MDLQDGDQSAAPLTRIQKGRPRKQRVRVKQKFGIPPVVHVYVAKLGTQLSASSHVNSLSCSSSLFVLLYSSYLSLSQSVYVAYYVVWQILSKSYVHHIALAILWVFFSIMPPVYQADVYNATGFL